MKIVCVNNIEIGRDSNGKSRHKKLPITVGQIYEADPDGIISLNEIKFYRLKQDNEESGITYPSHYFVTIEVWREMQLNKIIK